MVAEVIYKGPVPPAGERFCFVCAYTWKAAVNERYADQIEAAGKAPDGTVVVLDGVSGPGDPIRTPELAVASGLWGPLSNMGALDLCWSHVTGIRLQSAGGLHLPPPGGAMGMPPGFGMNGGRG